LITLIINAHPFKAQSAPKRSSLPALPNLNRPSA
jgi:hypothetical protein